MDCRRHRRLAITIVFLAALVLAAPASALLYNGGSYSNEYAKDKPNEATSSWGKVYDSSIFDTNVIDGVTVISVSSSQLVSAQGYLDGALVELTGEAVGDIMRADDGMVWVNVGTNDTLVGVRMSKEDAALISNMGRYGVRGTELAVAGTFHVSCDEHGGELDIHATRVVVKSEGGRIVKPFPQEKLFLAICLVAAGLVFLFAYRRLRTVSL